MLQYADKMLEGFQAWSGKEGRNDRGLQEILELHGYVSRFLSTARHTLGEDTTSGRQFPISDTAAGSRSAVLIRGRTSGAGLLNGGHDLLVAGDVAQKLSNPSKRPFGQRGYPPPGEMQLRGAARA